MLKSLGRISVDELPSLLMTDSESSLKLLKNLDTPRKSRHLEIKLEWIKMQVNSGKLVVVFKRGTDNPADLLTKCLATSLYVIHRCSLGFETCDGPIASITKSFGNYILIEVCCQPNSALSQEAKKKGMSYIGINDNMEQASVFKPVANFIREFGHPKVFVHVSSPCASGSPLRYLKGSQPTDADFEWFAMFPWVSKYLALGHYSSFELPWRNSIWKHHLTIETLRKNKHDYHHHQDSWQTYPPCLQASSHHHPRPHQEMPVRWMENTQHHQAWQFDQQTDQDGTPSNSTDGSLGLSPISSLGRSSTLACSAGQFSYLSQHFLL